MKYKHLTREERFTISCLKIKGHSTSFIAAQLARSKSTIHREIKRNSNATQIPRVITGLRKPLTTPHADLARPRAVPLGSMRTLGTSLLKCSQPNSGVLTKSPPILGNPSVRQSVMWPYIAGSTLIKSAVQSSTHPPTTMAKNLPGTK